MSNPLPMKAKTSKLVLPPGFKEWKSVSIGFKRMVIASKRKQVGIFVFDGLHNQPTEVYYYDSLPKKLT